MVLHLRVMTFGALLSYAAFQILIPLMFVASFVSFLWGAFLYVISGSTDEEMQEKGKAVMLYGLLAFVVMVLVWVVIRAVAAAVA